MADLNRIVVTATLTAEPELRVIGGALVCTLHEDLFGDRWETQNSNDPTRSPEVSRPPTMTTVPPRFSRHLPEA